MNGYHLVDYSPWPLYSSISLLTIVLGDYLILNLGILLLIVFQWFRDIIRESELGYHTKIVKKGLLIGFICFLLSEIFLFFSFFWTFFHSSLLSNIELALQWPPLGIITPSTWGLPLLGSLLLLISGFILTVSHHSIILGIKSKTINYLILSIILGIFFIIIQTIEYFYTTFTITDSIFGNIFFITTGLHGLHVICGVLYLTINLIRILQDKLTIEHHLGFEFAIYYWHLVDIVWLFVFVSYYWWGS